MSQLFVKRDYKQASEIKEDFFYDNNFGAEQYSFESEDKFLGKHLSDKRINIAMILILFGLVVLLGRSWQLQIFRNAYYSNLAENNRTRERSIVSARGLIYDSQGQTLVKNIPIFDAFILPKDLNYNITSRQQQVNHIAQTINIPVSDIEKVLAAKPFNFKYPLLVRENIDYQEALLLKIKAQQTPGLYIEIRNQREYIYPIEFSHLLGYLGKINDKELAVADKTDYLLNDYIGKNGLELTYEKLLRGKYGKELVEVDVTGQEKSVLYFEEPQSGENLVLSIDSHVQKNVREILLKNLAKFDKKKASVIMENPQTGEILALVSVPDFDNNLFSGGISSAEYKKLLADENNPLFDRATKGEYPSGSTIKPVVAAAALQEKIVTENTTFNSTGGIWISGRWFFPDWSSGGHGLTNVYRAIAWSVNTYFYIVGGGYEDFKGLEVSGLQKYYKLFGLGAVTGLDLVGENTGLVPDPAWKMKIKSEEWYIGDTYHMAIGQGDVLVTPLQVANYTAVFANGGKLFKPHLVKEIYSNDNINGKQFIEPVIIRENFIDSANLRIVKNAMRQTVTLGSAQYLNNLNVEVAGKTGTAQWATGKDNHAWFTGFAPFDDPQIVITVLVEEGGEGSAVSVPITYDILNWYFNQYLVADNI